MGAQAWGKERYVLSQLTDDALLAGTRRLVGTSNQLFADLLAHLAEVEERGVHRLRLCVSLYTYCIYELRFSEDAAFRRVSAARLVKAFPALFDAVAGGELHLTGLLMIGPHLTQANHLEVLARAKHRTKKEIAALIRHIDPLPDVPARIEPLGPTATPAIHAFRKPTYEQFVTSLYPVRDLPAGERPREWIDEDALSAAGEATVPDDIPSPSAPRELGPAPARKDHSDESGSDPALARNDPNDESDAEPALARRDLTLHDHAFGGIPAPGIFMTSQPAPLAGPQRYGVHFTAGDDYVQLVERAKALLSHTAAGCSLEELHMRAMQALVAQLEKRRYGVTARPAKPKSELEPSGAEMQNGPCSEDSDSDSESRPTPAAGAVGEAPRQRGRYVPASIRRAVYARDGARCTHLDSCGERCRETHFIELHHLRPFAMRGPHCVANLTLRCRAHNALSAENDFGRAQMEQKRSRPRHESPGHHKPQ